jgi:hypothetical protein
VVVVLDSKCSGAIINEGVPELVAGRMAEVSGSFYRAEVES